MSKFSFRYISFAIVKKQKLNQISILVHYCKSLDVQVLDRFSCIKSLSIIYFSAVMSFVLMRDERFLHWV